MLQVIGAAYGRTGTTSLKLALEVLGFGKCYHFTEMLRKWHVPQWLAAAHGGRIDWDAIFTEFRSTTDWPAAAYYSELAAFYPEAKVILAQRDADQWYRSIRSTIYPLRRALPTWLPGFRALARLSDSIIWNGTFGGKLTDRDHAIAVYELHNRAVRAAIPSSRLLVFDVRDGWAPLCEFLGVPVPQGVAFPHSNDAHRVMCALWALRIGQCVFASALIALAVWSLLSVIGG
jgi:hypothetical protein